MVRCASGLYAFISTRHFQLSGAANLFISPTGSDECRTAIREVTYEADLTYLSVLATLPRKAGISCKYHDAGMLRNVGLSADHTNMRFSLFQRDVDQGVTDGGMV